MTQAGTIQGTPASAFIDNGASFNAISPALAEQLKLHIKEYPKPLKITLGVNKTVMIPRRVARFKVCLDGFSSYATRAFVMDIPEEQDILLGMTWFQQVNPDIDWSKNTIAPRTGSSDPLIFRQCVRNAPARTVGKSRKRIIRRTQRVLEAEASEKLRYFYTTNDLVTASGRTRVVPLTRVHKLLSASDVEVCFVLNAQKDSSPQALSWDDLENHPAAPVVFKYRDTVFREQLPTEPPERRTALEAEIELSDNEPVARKQFRLSPEMKTALQEWTRDMLAAGIIRPSNSPFCAPTFCVKKSDGSWRIVHDFRGINAKVRVPATPIPRKEDTYDAMAGAIDLLWGFFQVRLRKQDIPYTAFATPDGLFEYLVTPMGLSSSPSAFNRLIQSIFKDQSTFCRAYFDDLFVFTKSPQIEDHLTALDQVLKRCEEEQLYV